MNTYVSIETILHRIVSQCYFITDVQADALLAAGYGHIPVLVRRNMGRERIRLSELKAHLEKPLQAGDFLRDVSTWPQYLSV